MNYSLSVLYQLKEEDIVSSAEMYSRAYADYPFIVYFAADEKKRDLFGRDFYSFIFRLSLKYGEIYATSSELEGVAMWEYSHKKPHVLQIINEGALKLLPQVGLKITLRALRIFNYCEDRRKTKVTGKHMHLSALGVDPLHQGKGHSAFLIRTMFERLNEENLPCVLETQTENNIKLYSHLGFRVIDETIILNTGITNWLMVRYPE